VNGDGYSDVIVGARYYDVFNAPDEGAAYVFHGSASGLSASANWTNESNQTNAQFGVSVSTAGDVNGDGYSDVIIGSFMYDNGQTDEGKAFVYFGSSAGLSANSNWAAESDQANAQYGCSVATAGDVNGDGFSDVIVGAQSFDNGQTDEGRAYVYHGFAAGLSATANWTAESNQATAFFGNSVSTAGDMNGDGYSDVIVGAPYFDNGLTDAGKVYVYFGSASGLSASPDWTTDGSISSMKLGFCVSTAGDVNGDGYCDVILGAPFLSNGESSEGRVYVFAGSSSGSIFQIWWKESNQANANFGYSVSTAGDVNGDGFSDVIVGAPNSIYNPTDVGKAFVFCGSASGLSTSANWTFQNDQLDANYGTSVSTAGDVNGDGYSDVIVGAPYYKLGQYYHGKVYAYYGSASGLSASENWALISDIGSAQFGRSVSDAGDVNGDGFSDVIVGAPYYYGGQYYEGWAFAYYGSASGLNTSANWFAKSYQETSFFGESVSTAGDVNGDGYGDVIIGAPWFNNGQVKEGRAFVYFGSASGLSSYANWSTESDQDNAYFGYSVSTAGDVNGDGYSDVIVGAYSFDNGQPDEGRAFMFYGNSGTGLTSTVRQYKPGSGNIVYSGGLTGSNGQVRLNIFGKSPYGRADGRIVYEYKVNGIPFSGSPVTNSVLYSGTGTMNDLGSALSGIQLNNDVSGLLTNKLYKWRARVMYSSVNNPFQKYGPWKYFNNYVPTPLGNFRPSNSSALNKQFNLTMLIQGFYNASSNTLIQDTVTVYLRNISPPYAIRDSAKGYLNSSGQGSLNFSNALNGVSYYIHLKHRNSVETWSKTPQGFTNNFLVYDFTTGAAKAFGDNMIQIDSSPLKFAIYGGDVNQDGTVDATDLSMIDNDVSVFAVGYLATDLTGDDFTDGTDYAIADNNATAFVSSVTP
jgi:hypothetical protein